jgi:hypothetical protein
MLIIASSGISVCWLGGESQKIYIKSEHGESETKDAIIQRRKNSIEPLTSPRALL